MKLLTVLIICFLSVGCSTKRQVKMYSGSVAVDSVTGFDLTYRVIGDTIYIREHTFSRGTRVIYTGVVKDYSSIKNQEVTDE